MLPFSYKLVPAKPTATMVSKPTTTFVSMIFSLWNTISQYDDRYCREDGQGCQLRTSPAGNTGSRGHPLIKPDTAKPLSSFFVLPPPPHPPPPPTPPPLPSPHPPAPPPPPL